MLSVDSDVAVAMQDTISTGYAVSGNKCGDLYLLVSLVAAYPQI